MSICKKILVELKSPDTKLNFENSKVSFNEQDITPDFNMWVDAYITGDYKRVGFIFGDTIRKNSEIGNDPNF